MNLVQDSEVLLGSGKEALKLVNGSEFEATGRECFMVDPLSQFCPWLVGADHPGYGWTSMSLTFERSYRSLH